MVKSKYSEARANLTDEIRQEIRERYAAEGIFQRQLAEEYGLSTKDISSITRGFADNNEENNEHYKKNKEAYSQYREKNRERIRECNRKSIMKRKKENPKRFKELMAKNDKRYREKNIEEILKREKKQREKNREKRREESKRWREENPEKFRESYTKYREENPDKIKETRKKSYEKNADKINERKRRSYKDNPVKERLRTCFWGAMKKYSESGKTSTSKKYGIDYKACVEKLEQEAQRIFGCTIQEMIELGYQVDHIIPLELYDFNNPGDIKGSFSPENLRWLPGKENASKRSRIRQCDLDAIKQISSEVFPKALNLEGILELVIEDDFEDSNLEGVA